MQLKLYKKNIYTIPFQDKFIIYQPLNKFAFIGNSAMVNIIEDIVNDIEIDKEKHTNVLNFLNSYGFFNQYSIDEQQQEKKNYKPTVCVLCMTSACNFRCTYCFADGGEAKFSELSLETGKTAIDIAYNNSLEINAENFTVAFHGGGEPTLPLKKMQELTSYARSKNKKCIVELTSNGYWNDEKAEWILSNIDNLTLSFDGIEEIQNKQRPLVNGEDSFKVIMKNIKKLDENKLKYGFRLTVTNKSVSQLSESIEFLCKQTVCTTFQVEPAFGAGRALNNNQIIEDNKQFVQHFLKAYDIALLHNKYLYYSGARPWVLTNRFCTAHDNALVVTPDGLLSSCYEISSAEHQLAKAFHFGKLTSKGNLIIDYKIREKFQKKIQERKELCEKCFAYWHCAGDCPAKTIDANSFENNTFSERCNVNREITKELLIKYMSENEGIYKG